MRVFISLKFSEKISKEIQKIQSSLPSFKGKKTNIENLHLTLKFLDEISLDELNEIKSKLEKINFPTFKSQLGEIGFFDNDGRGIIWVSIINCEFLQKEIDSVLSTMFVNEQRFMGHITIARVKKISDKKIFLEKLKNIVFEKLSFTVDKFYIIESKLNKEGPEYFTLGEYNLR